MKFLLRRAVFWPLMLSTVLASAQEIYVCTDAKGHKLTSDRPISECLDREQRVFGAGGIVKRTVGPSLTAQERATLDDTQKREAEEQARLAEDRRRDRALLIRYPNQAAHDRERAEAFVQIDEGIRLSQLRLQELALQRKAWDTEMEFYQKDPSKAPLALQRRMSEIAQSVAAQQRFIADQDEEKKRINQRFDEELAKLRPRWIQQAAATAPPPATGGTARVK